jgi:aspartyl-tRNA(Asn)/glutamyl-tRNA(Gln) amidotransferase subunit A
LSVLSASSVLPVLSVPLRRPGLLPLGVQLIGAPGSESLLFSVAAKLEAIGVVGFSDPPRNGRY